MKDYKHFIDDSKNAPDKILVEQMLEYLIDNGMSFHYHYNTSFGRNTLRLIRLTSNFPNLEAINKVVKILGVEQVTIYYKNLSGMGILKFEDCDKLKSLDLDNIIIDGVIVNGCNKLNSLFLYGSKIKKLKYDKKPKFIYKNKFTKINY